MTKDDLLERVLGGNKMTKEIIQITADKYYLYALTKDNKVYRFMSSAKLWEELPQIEEKTTYVKPVKAK